MASDGFAQTTARQYCNRGVARQNKGDLDGALADYSRAIELDPHDATAYNDRGLVKVAKGDLDGALADYNRALELTPRNFEIHGNRAAARQRKGDLDGALTDYTVGIKLWYKYATGYRSRAKIKIAKHDLDGAIEDCNHAIGLNPKDAAAYNIRAQVETAKGDQNAAAADFDRASKLDPKYRSPPPGNKAKVDSAGGTKKNPPTETKNPDAGKTHDVPPQAKNVSRPEPASTPPMEIEPKNIAAVYDRDVAKRTQSDHDTTIAQHVPAVELPPKTVEAPGDAARRRALDRPAEKTSPIVELAPREIETPSSTGLPKPNTNDLSGEVAPPAEGPEPKKLASPADATPATQDDNVSAGSTDYQRATEPDPTSASGYANRAQFRTAIGDLDGALADYNRAIELDAKSAPAYNGRANVRRARHDINGALADYNHAIELDGGYATAYYNRAITKQDKGDLNDALADLNPAIQLDPNNAAAYNSRGTVRTMDGDLDGALADYNRAIELEPKNAATYNNRAALFFATRNWGAALQDYDRFFGLSKEDQEYPRLYVWLIRVRTGQTGAANKELVDYLQQRGTTADWFSTVTSHVLGKKSDADLLTAAKSSDKRKERGQLCEAWFYIGMKKLMAGDKAGAEGCFNKSLATDQKDSTEYHFARAELKALAK